MTDRNLPYLGFKRGERIPWRMRRSQRIALVIGVVAALYGLWNYLQLGYL